MNRFVTPDRELSVQSNRPFSLYPSFSNSLLHKSCVDREHRAHYLTHFHVSAAFYVSVILHSHRTPAVPHTAVVVSTKVVWKNSGLSQNHSASSVSHRNRLKQSDKNYSHPTACGNASLSGPSN